MPTNVSKTIIEMECFLSLYMLQVLVVTYSVLAFSGVVTLEDFIAFVKGGDNKGTADSKASGDIQVRE